MTISFPHAPAVHVVVRFGVGMRDDTKPNFVSMLPTATPTAAMGPVYGLVSGLENPNESPSHAHAQSRTASSSLTYRCGGSAGITRSASPASRLIRADDSQRKHLKARAVC